MNCVGFSLSVEFLAVSLRGGLLFAWHLGVDFDVVLVDRYFISLLMYLYPPISPWALTFVHYPSEWDTNEEF